MIMMSCIFCRRDATLSNVSHILPASLGGTEWACLPRGLVCSSCNQYFGDKVEQPALNSFPFLPFRVLLGIPTRKGKAPKMDSYLGTIVGSPLPGEFAVDPASSAIKKGLDTGEITLIVLPAEPTEAAAVSRMLVKMGLETIARHSRDEALCARYDAARLFARSPSKGSTWWFLIHTDHPTLFAKFTSGVSLNDWLTQVSLAVVEEQDIKTFHLRLLGMTIITPLDKDILPPDMTGLAAPDHRLFQVTI